ncbi:MAG: M48 family metalloprotease [Bacteroidia bacterium]|nr:M48 family metalloprotease [Bacteroidia bacterium]
MKRRICICCFVFLVLSLPSMGQTGNQKEALTLEVTSVSKRLLSVLDSIPGDLKWPPVFEIIESDQVNAYAGVKENQPKVVIHTSLNTITEGMPDRLAYIIAHELIHIVKGHCNSSGFAGTGSLNYLFTRADEEVADIEGLKLLLKAGYSYKEAVNTFKVIRNKLGDYSPLEAQSVDHPSWTQRLEYTDKSQAKLWRSMSAFNTGVTLLMVQNYDAAIVCFDKVIKEFPVCFEAYSNMGYANLMQYCDLFDEEDITYFNIGQIVVGGFYRRPVSLERAIRGVNPELWWKAIANFRRALDINPDLSLVKSYLGIAYFLDPEKLSIQESERYFTEALRSVEKDGTLDSSLKACVYLNAGAIDIAKNNFTAAENKIDTARLFQDLFKRDRSSAAFRSSVTGNINYSLIIDYALDFNMVLSEYKKTNGTLKSENIRVLMKYLRNTDPASIWWKVAYQVYEAGSTKLGQQLLTQTQILSEISPISSPVRSISVDGFMIYLSQNTDEILKKFVNYEQVPVVEERKIFEYIFAKEHIEILGGKEVLGILIKAPNPLIKLGSTAAGLKDIQVGMPYETIRTRFDGMNLSYLTLPGRQVKYFFYNDIGMAFAVTDSIITEILIIQKPSENR